MTYYNGTLFPPDIQSFPLPISELKLLQRRDPIKFGETLSELKKQGLNHNQIAAQLSLNRNVVGRYLRMAQWDSQLKEAIKASKNITNTMLLKAASAVSALSELKELLQPAIKEPAPEAVSPRPTPFFNGVTQECEASPNVLATQVIPEQCTTHVSPLYGVFLACISLVLMIFLMHQGYLFFSSIEEDQVSAISGAVIAELVPCTAALMYGLARSRTLRLLLSLMILCSIGGLAFFMYTSLAERMQTQSATTKHVQLERHILEQALVSLGLSLNSLPHSHVSKRQAVIEHMQELRGQLSELSARPVAATSNHESIQLAYSVWLRVAAMLMNALLIHFLLGHMRTKR